MNANYISVAAAGALIWATSTAHALTEGGSAEGAAVPAAEAPAGEGDPEQDTAAEADTEAAAAGDRPAPNSIYAEGLGAGLAYSFNYERLVIDDLGVRAGFSYLSASASTTTSQGTTEASSTFMTFPLTASYIGLRGGKHALELGGGVTLTYASASGSALGVSSSASGMGALGNALVGYRIHPIDGAGFNFRIGLMALLGKGLSFSNPDPDALGVLPWGYLSMGASF